MEPGQCGGGTTEARLQARLQRSSRPPDEHSIPWLLLTATPAPDSASSGTFHGVTYVRRADTQGGVAPAVSGCDAAHIGLQARVPYSATYYFF